MLRSPRRGRKRSKKPRRNKDVEKGEALLILHLPLSLKGEGD